MISKPTEALQFMTVHYTHRKAVTCFVYLCGHLHGDALRRRDTLRYYIS